MSIEEQIRTEMREVGLSVDPGIALALARVESGVRRQRTRRNIALAVAAAVVAIAGVLWGTGSIDSLPAPEDVQPIEQPSEPGGLAIDADGGWARVEDPDLPDTGELNAVVEVDGRLAGWAIDFSKP